MKKYICVIVSVFMLVLLTSCGAAQTKNSEMKVAVFGYSDSKDLETKVNTWLSDHSETEIIDVQFSTTNTGGSFPRTIYSCMVWYYDVEQDTETTYNSGGHTVHD